MPKYTEKQKLIAQYAKALGNPARIAILEFLAAQDTCFFGAIHEILPIAKATASQHLKALSEAGLIQGEIQAPKVKYCINRANWEEAQALLGDFFKATPKENCCP